MSHPKELAYDELISPLMARIIELCKEHKINFAAQFALGPHPEEDGPLLCTTVVIPDSDDAEGKDQITKVSRVMRPVAQFAAFTIISTKP